MSDVILAGLMFATIPLSCIALLLSCVAIAYVVGLRNSTHRIEWKTYDPDRGGSQDADDESGDELDGESMLTENPNKRIRKNPPFEPFPAPPKPEAEPFFDEDDPNNTSHDF